MSEAGSGVPSPGSSDRSLAMKVQGFWKMSGCSDAGASILRCDKAKSIAWEQNVLFLCAKNESREWLKV